MNPVKYSVVVPLFNKSPYIARAVQSVLAQTYGDFEIVVLDDGSTDDSLQKVAKIIDRRIRLIVQSNQGVSATRNRGIERARGELIAFLDADDLWADNFLQTIDELVNRFPSSGMYAAGYRKLFASGFSQQISLASLGPIEQPLEPTDYFSYAQKLPLVHTSSVCIPSRVFDAVGCFDTRACRGEDTDMWGRIALKYPVAVSPQVCNIYRLDASGRTPSLKDSRSIPPFIASARRAIERNEVASPLLPSLENYLGKLWLEHYFKVVRMGDKQEAVRILREELSDCSYFQRTVEWLLRLHKTMPLGMLDKLFQAVRSRYGARLSLLLPDLPGLTRTG